MSNIPSAGTGNAASCAEHAVYLMLATLRDHNEMAASAAQVWAGAAGVGPECCWQGSQPLRAGLRIGEHGCLDRLATRYLGWAGSTT